MPGHQLNMLASNPKQQTMLRCWPIKCVKRPCKPLAPSARASCRSLQLWRVCKRLATSCTNGILTCKLEINSCINDMLTCANSWMLPTMISPGSDRLLRESDVHRRRCRRIPLPPHQHLRARPGIMRIMVFKMDLT